MALEGEQMSFLEKTVDLIERKGMWRIVKALLVILVFVYFINNGEQFLGGIIDTVTTEAIKKEDKLKDDEHTAALEVRKQIRPKIINILKQILSDLNADRVFVMEMHNGTNNTAGLPFIYGEMTYEEVADNVNHVDEDYTQLNLSRFDFPLYVEHNHLWQGSIDELSKIDEKLAKRLSSNDVTYFVILHIHGIKTELGYFGVSYCHNKEPKDSNYIVTKMVEATQKLSTLLDATNINYDSVNENEVE